MTKRVILFDRTWINLEDEINIAHLISRFRFPAAHTTIPAGLETTTVCRCRPST